MAEPSLGVGSQNPSDAAQYFQSMADYVGFSTDDIETIRRTKPLLEAHLAEVMGQFYAHLLRYPPTRRFFLNKEGLVDQEYLELRMRHQTNFWLRVCDGQLGEEFARFLEYVGRAHTAKGADPRIYIAERYVSGQVGFMSRAIEEVLRIELAQDEAFQLQALEAWNKLLMILLEMLARAYGDEHKTEGSEPILSIDERAVERLAEEAYRLEHDRDRVLPRKRISVAAVGDIREGNRKIVQIGNLSIGIFQHQGKFYALRNSCLHRGGPVCTGTLEGSTLTCPWHGFQYKVTTGELLLDPKARLDTYPVEVADAEIYVLVPETTKITQTTQAAPQSTHLQPNQFLTTEIKPGTCKLLKLAGQDVVVYNLEGTFFATQEACTHMDGPLDEGGLEGYVITCPYHGSQFDLRDGQVLRGPAKDPLQTFQVIVEDGIGRVDLSP